MTLQEAENFINIELKGLWPDWNPTDAEARLWARELMKVDYNLTKNSISNWYIRQERTRKRPFLGQLRKLFRKTVADVEEQKELSEPVLLYEIVKESNIVKRFFKDHRTGEDVEYTSHPGQKFYLSRRNKLPVDPHNIEAEAENKRERFNQAYGGNHIIYRHWERLYSEFS